MHIKVCGLTRRDNAVDIARAGVDYLGINHWPPSKRFCQVADGAAIAAAVRATQLPTKLVGLFVNQPVDHVATAAIDNGYDVVQLHGDEDADYIAHLQMLLRMAATPIAIWRALPVTKPVTVDELAGYDADLVLLDAPVAGRGGAGQTFDWHWIATAVASSPVALGLAGGLAPGNVGQALATVLAGTGYGATHEHRLHVIDVASGVESAPGIKSLDLVEQFVAAVRAATMP